MTWLSYPSWLNAGDNAWQMTAATFVGLMSLPGLAVLYGGVMQKRWSVNAHDAHVRGVLRDADRLVSVGVQDGLRPSDRAQWLGPVRHAKVPRDVPRRTWQCAQPYRRGGPGGNPVDHDRPAVPLPSVLARLLPVRVRRHHADPGAWVGTRPRQLQGVDPVCAALDHVRVHGERVPDLGRRLLRGPRRAGLLRWLRDPPVGRRLRVRVRRRDRSAIATRSRDRCTEQPVDVGRAVRVCCGSAGTGSTAGTPTTPAPTPRRRCSTRTSPPRWR